MYVLNIDSNILHAAETASLGSEFTLTRALVNSASIEGMSRPLINSANDRLGVELPSEIMPPAMYVRLQRDNIASSFLLNSLLMSVAGMPYIVRELSSISGSSM